MNTESELRLQAYLDNEVSASEGRQIASWIARDAEARSLYEELKATRALLSGNEPVLTVPETRDFYWSQIQRRIAVAEREPAVAARPHRWWLKLLAPAAGLAAIALVAFSSLNTNRAGRIASITESVEHADRTISFYSADHRMSVVWIPLEEPQVAEASFDDFE